VTLKNGTSIAYWWFDPVKAARLDEMRRAQPAVADNGSGATPGLGTALAVAVGAGVIGLFVFRRVLRRTSRP
jgi:hypothetical protein